MITFKAPKKGYFWADMTLINCVDTYDGSDASNICSAGYKLTANYRDYEKYSYICIGDGVYKTSEFCFKPNTKVTLKLYGDYTAVFKQYLTYTLRLNVRTKSPSRFETEGNNSKSKADKLKLKKAFSGITNYKDTDYWVFKAPKKGKYKFKFVCTKGEEFDLLFIKKSKVIDREYVKLGDGWGKFSVKLKKGQKIYLKAFQDSYWSSNYSKYKIKVTRK